MQTITDQSLTTVLLRTPITQMIFFRGKRRTDITYCILINYFVCNHSIVRFHFWHISRVCHCHVELTARHKLLLYLNRISVYGLNKITGIKRIKSSYNSTEPLFRQARQIVLVIVPRSRHLLVILKSRLPLQHYCKLV